MPGRVHGVRRLIAAVVVIAFSAVTCVSHNSSFNFLSNNYKIIKKGSKCYPDKEFPQVVLVPFFKHATQVVNDCDVYPNHKVGFSLLIFYHKWVENFGDPDLKVKELLERVMIQWGDEVKVSPKGFSVDGTPFFNRNIIGRVVGPSVIWVFKGYDGKVSETALIHELVHIAIRVQTGDHGDPDHEGNKYNGWTVSHTRMIHEVNQMLRAFNL